MRTVLKLVVLAGALILAVDLAVAQGSWHEAGYLYLSPMPGAEYTPPKTRFVLVRFEQISPSAVTNLSSFIQVTGTSSGNHPGETKTATDGRTVIFKMSADFQTNETVSVALNPLLEIGTAGTVEPYEYQFTTSGPTPGAAQAAVTPLPEPVGFSKETEWDGPQAGPTPSPPENTATARILPNGVSVPSDFPQVVVSVNREPSPGYNFLHNPGQTGLPYTLKLDGNGYPVWYLRGGGPNFRVQNNGMITWSINVAHDQNFNYVKNYSAANGYGANWHDFRLLADGTALMLGDWSETVDMTRYFAGANPHAQVVERIIQEFTAAGELIFQWRAWDHYDIRDLQIVDPLAAYISFPHMKALTTDEDGHILVSCRHLNEVTKINRDSGEIVWRLGGRHSDFTFVNDPWNGFSGQHDISALGDNHYMVFDNGNLRNPSASRAVEYQLDLTDMTATMVWQFRHSPDWFTDVMGNAQRLPDGHTLIDFVQGNHPRVVEVDSDGVQQYELDVTPHAQIYRALKFPWTGVVAAPYLIVEPYPENTTLIFNKFGDTNVAYYKIYGGTSPHPTTLLQTSQTTLKALTNLENGQRYYFRVTAVNRQGVEGDFSNEENVNVNVVKPGEQMVRNRDFSQGTASWIWAVSGGASAQWEITNGVSQFQISSGGSAASSIELRQNGIPLIQGRKYVFEFDAWARGPRYIEATVGQDVSPFANYSGIGSTYLTPVKNHFRYVFAMPATSDLGSRVVFDLGTSTLDVYLENVSLFNAPPGDFNLDGRVDEQDLAVMAGEWLEQQTNLSSDLDGDGKVDFKDYAVFGANWSGAGP
jgi:Arylsulfotransferase (ASST)/Carbohydrate binding domain/Dockerin type I domain